MYENKHLSHRKSSLREDIKRQSLYIRNYIQNLDARTMYCSNKEFVDAGNVLVASFWGTKSNHITFIVYIKHRHWWINHKRVFLFNYNHSYTKDICNFFFWRLSIIRPVPKNSTKRNSIHIQNFALCCSYLHAWCWLDLRAETSRQKNIHKCLLRVIYNWIKTFIYVYLLSLKCVCVRLDVTANTRV
jgi:hypothetical protein